MRGPQKLCGNLQNGQRGQAQKIKLHQPSGLDVVFVKLAYRRLAAGLLVQRTKVGELTRRNQHPTGVHAHVARNAFELLRHAQQLAHLFFAGGALGQRGLVAQRVGNGDVLPRLIGNQLGHAVAKGVRHVEHPPHIAHRRARGHGAKGGNLAHRIAPVTVFYVVNHPVTVGLAKVNIKVGHGDPLGI